MTMADSVESLGVELRTRIKKLGAKEQARRKKCRLRFSLTKKNKVFQKSYTKVGVNKLFWTDMVPARTWRVHAVEMAPTERLKLGRQMAAAAGKKSTTSLSLFMEVFGLEGEEELPIMATQTWAEGAWIGKWHTEQKEAWLNQVFEVQTWRQVRGPAGAVMCETRDLGMRWPQRHTLIFEGRVRVDMRYVCPKDAKNMLLKQARSAYWKTWAAKHEYEELKEGAGFGLAAKEKQRKGGLKSIETLPENWVWNEAGCRRHSSTMVGQMKVNAKLATRRKAQKSTGSTTFQNGTKSDEGLQRVSEGGSKKSENIKRKSGSGKEVLSRIHPVKANGTGVTSV